MAVLTPVRHMTVEEFLQLEQSAGAFDYELHYGELVQGTRPKKGHHVTQDRLVEILKPVRLPTLPLKCMIGKRSVLKMVVCNSGPLTIRNGTFASPRKIKLHETTGQTTKFLSPHSAEPYSNCPKFSTRNHDPFKQRYTSISDTHENPARRL